MLGVRHYMTNTNVRILTLLTTETLLFETNILYFKSVEQKVVKLVNIFIVRGNFLQGCQ